jgi:hypothetical protein
MPEYVEEKIAFPDKADTKAIAVFGFRGHTFCAPAPEICDAVKVRLI